MRSKIALASIALASLAGIALATDPRKIAGIHDAAGFDALPRGTVSWVVETTTVSAPPGPDPLGYLRHVTDAGVGVIVRVNYGYSNKGTIPPVGPGQAYASFDDWASAVAALAAASPHVRRWIVGNEINVPVEWPTCSDLGGGSHVQPLTVDVYARCYAKVYDAIKRVRPDALVMPAPVAPCSGDPGTGDGDSLATFTKLMARCQDRCDGVALHAYTHGQDPALASSDAMMQSLPNMHFELRVYRDFLGALPDSLKKKPVFITECNPGHWQDTNTGWVQAVFREIEAWNASGGQTIRCLALYRWSDADPGYGLEKFPKVQDDLRAAASLGIESPDAPAPSPAPADSGIVPALDQSLGD